MFLKIKNGKELNTWMNERRLMCHDMSAIKGKTPVGATYSDGTPITSYVNVQCCGAGWNLRLLNF